jgi:hypothetical protein
VKRRLRPADVWGVKAWLLPVLKLLSSGAMVAFMACWVTAFVVRPWPNWLIPASVVMFGFGFVSTLLYHVVNHGLGDSVEAAHRELEAPTSVSNLIKQNPVGPFFVWIVFVVVSFGSLHAKNTLHLQSVTALPLGLIIGTAVWWLLMSAYAKGWVRDE